MKTLQEIEPMFEQPTLGLLMQALEWYHRPWWKGGDGPRELRLPCRFLIVSLAEDGDRRLTGVERQLIRQAVRKYLRTHPQAAEWLEEFL